MASKTVTVPARHKGLLAAYITPEEAGILVDMFHKESDPPKAGPGGLLMYEGGEGGGEDAMLEYEYEKAAEKAAGRKLTMDEKASIVGGVWGGAEDGDKISSSEGAKRYGEALKAGTHSSAPITASASVIETLGYDPGSDVDMSYDYDEGRYRASEHVEMSPHEAGEDYGYGHGDDAGRMGYYVPEGGKYTKIMDPVGSGSSTPSTVLPFPGAGGGVTTISSPGLMPASGGGGGVRVPSGPGGYRAPSRGGVRPLSGGYVPYSRYSLKYPMTLPEAPSGAGAADPYRTGRKATWESTGVPMELWDYEAPTIRGMRGGGGFMAGGTPTSYAPIAPAGLVGGPGGGPGGGIGPGSFVDGGWEPTFETFEGGADPFGGPTSTWGGYLPGMGGVAAGYTGADPTWAGSSSYGGYVPGAHHVGVEMEPHDYTSPVSTTALDDYVSPVPSSVVTGIAPPSVLSAPVSAPVPTFSFDDGFIAGAGESALSDIYSGELGYGGGFAEGRGDTGSGGMGGWT